MGDLTFWAIVGRLASPAHPLIELDVQPRPDRLPSGIMRLTETGRGALAGRADHLALNGLDRWMGGTHLTPSTPLAMDGRDARRSGRRLLGALGGRAQRWENWSVGRLRSVSIFARRSTPRFRVI